MLIMPKMHFVKNLHAISYASQQQVHTDFYSD